MKPRAKPVPACTQASHAEIKATLELFQASTINHKPWVIEDEGVNMLQGDCPKCRSTLYFDFDTADIEEPSLTDALLRAGFTHCRADSAALGKHDIIDATGEVVATLDCRDAWAWLEQQRRPKCFESYGNLKHHVVEELEAIQRRIVAVDREVC